MNRYDTKKKKMNYKKTKVHPEAEAYDLCEWLNFHFQVANVEFGEAGENPDKARLENKRVVFEFRGNSYEVTKVKEE